MWILYSGSDNKRLGVLNYIINNNDANKTDYAKLCGVCAGFVRQYCDIVE